MADLFAMEPERIDEFLRENVYGALATLRKSGSPIVIPVGVLRRDARFYVSMRADQAGVRRIRNDPRVSLAVFATAWPPSYVVVEGTAHEVPDDDHVLKVEAAMPTVRMLGLDDAGVSAWLASYVDIPRLVFEIVATHIATMDGEKVRNADMNTFVLKPA